MEHENGLVISLVFKNTTVTCILIVVIDFFFFKAFAKLR